MSRREAIANLVGNARNGDLAAFDEIVRRMQDFAFAYALQWTGDPDDAEDAAQCAFVEAFRQLHLLRDDQAFVGWFRAILRTQCDRLTRRPARHISLEYASGLPSTELMPDTETEVRELRRLVWRQVERLPAPLREVVLLRYFGDASVRQAAEFLGVPEGTVKRRLYDARALLREGELRMLSDSSDARPSRDESFAQRVRMLIAAAAEGRTKEVRKLLRDEPSLVQEAGPHPYWGGKPYALHTAAEHGQLEIVEALLAAGASPAPPSHQYDGWTPLLLAISGNHAKVVERLLAAGAEWDAWSAASAGEVNQLHRLIVADPDLVRARGPNNATPLHFARTPSVVQLLLDAGSDLTLLDKYGSTPTRVVAYSRRSEQAAGRLLRDVSGEDDIFITTAVGDHEAIWARVSDSPEELHRMDDHLSGASAYGVCPLHVAVTKGVLATATLLLDLGADPNGRAKDGETALHYAARFGDGPMIELLLSRGADRSLRENIHNGTPSDWAEFFRQPHVLPLLGPPSRSAAG